MTACAATFETVDVIATCLLSPGHVGPHHDYSNGVRWDAGVRDELIGAYCPACSAAPGTPCSDPLSGREVAYHAARGSTLRVF